MVKAQPTRIQLKGPQMSKYLWRQWGPKQAAADYDTQTYWEEKMCCNTSANKSSLPNGTPTGILLITHLYVLVSVIIWLMEATAASSNSK